MYKEFYLQAKDASDRISEGTYEQPDRGYTTGVIEKRKPKKDPNFADFMLEYMGKAKKPVNTNYDVGMSYSGTDALNKAVNAISSIESNHNYEAIGPEVKKGMYKGQRAIGKYQVMEGNIGPWSKAALGRTVTKEEFLKNTSIQDIIVKHQMMQSFRKYGTWEDAASVWFTGRPVTNESSKASDGWTTGSEYINRFRNAFYVQ